MPRRAMAHVCSSSLLTPLKSPIPDVLNDHDAVHYDEVPATEPDSTGWARYSLSSKAATQRRANRRLTWQSKVGLAAVFRSECIQ